MIIQVGEKWRLKNNPSRIATIAKAFPVQAEKIAATWGLKVGDTVFVVLDAPWNKKGRVGKHITTFLKQYEKAETNGWISVKDQLPERNSNVLYWHKPPAGYGPHGYPAIADEWRDEDHLQFASHWMPIREPRE